MANTTEDKSSKQTKTDAEEALREETSQGAAAVEAEPDANETTDDDAALAPDVDPDPDAEGTAAVDAVPDANETTDDAEVVEASAASGDETAADDTVEEEPVETAAPSDPVAVAPVPAVQPEQKRGGFVPLVLGGAVAAGLGYAAAFFGVVGGDSPFETETRDALTTQQAQISDLGALPDAVTNLQAQVDGIDLGALDAGLAGVQDALSDMDGRLTGLGDQIAAIDSRMTALEKQPFAEAVSPEAIAAYERELEQLRTAVADQKAALEIEKAALTETLNQRTAEMQQIVEEARALENNAEEQARLAAARAALSDVIAQVQAGAPFAEPLAMLGDNGVDVPEALSATAADGVPTVAALAASFPDAARAALSASRTAATPEGEEPASGGFGAFFQSQLGARSVTPKEGTSTDAILSRAEAAVGQGDLDTALGELDALPQPAKDAMSDWLARADLRRDALAAASGLAQDLNQQ
ncbi:mitofilin family membrane protein [Sagittula sp. SSi028]|uniref:COG4223 family protein n=1 Tax=Sagittula sp. SSi028 TaxID=3400636 RepID=UPI003AF56785